MNQKSEQMPKRYRRFAIFCISLILTLCISLLTAFGIWHHRCAFTAEKWLEQEEERHRMISSLLTKHELIGMQEAEIIALLGAETAGAPERFKYPDGNFPDADNLTYYLGVRYIDTEWLVITMEGGMAVSHTVGCN